MRNEPTPEQSEQIANAIATGKKIEAIKLYRSFTGSDLMESKNFIEKLTVELREKDPQRFAKQPAVTGCLVVALILGLFFSAMLLSCSKTPITNVDTYKPGLGEIMGLQQIRHGKLWFAGDNQNWDLAAYELDELKEGFDDAVKFHPTHENVPRPLGELVPQFIDPQVASLDKAIKARNREMFATAYDNLTASCTGCHQAANHGFNIIKRPTVPPFSNQDFAPRK